MWQVHRRYRPWFAGLVNALPDDVTVFHIRNPREWGEFASQQCGSDPGCVDDNS
jgi:hypothetical protein